MTSPGWCFLAAMIIAYGVANLLQSVAAARTGLHQTLHPGLLVRLAGQRVYLIGVGCQVLGFVLAFLARRDLPLFLVQASVAAGLGLTAVLGVLVLKWRLPRAEVALLVLLVAGIAALVLAAKPAPSRPLGGTATIGLVVAVGVIAATAFFAVRLHGAPGSVALGALAGLAFASAAVAARPLASVHSADEFLTHPLFYLVLAHAVVGQLLLALAMQRGSTTAAVAAMDAAGAVPAAALGLLLLGDQIWAGREWLAGTGFVATLVAVLALARYAEPQCHHRTPATPDREPGPATAGVPAPAPRPAPTPPATPARPSRAPRPVATPTVRQLAQAVSGTRPVGALRRSETRNPVRAPRP